MTSQLVYISIKHKWAEQTCTFSQFLPPDKFYVGKADFMPDLKQPSYVLRFLNENKTQMRKNRNWTSPHSPPHKLSSRQAMIFRLEDLHCECEHRLQQKWLFIVSRRGKVESFCIVVVVEYQQSLNRSLLAFFSASALSLSYNPLERTRESSIFDVVCASTRENVEKERK